MVQNCGLTRLCNLREFPYSLQLINMICTEGRMMIFAIKGRS